MVCKIVVSVKMIRSCHSTNIINIGYLHYVIWTIVEDS